MLDWLSQSDFMPHGHCYYWRPDILWMHVVSDAVIALAYFSIPVTLLYFLRRRPDTPFPAVVVLFAAFIVLCGAGHVLEIWTVWNPIYALQGVEKAATAVVSIVTAVAMVPLVPRALAMRTPAELQREVDRAVGRLRETQDQLVQNEKLASLGALVAGVAHEINTPVGIGVTASSSLRESIERLSRQHQAGALTRDEFDDFVGAAAESAHVIQRNLQRAAELIRSFKQVAVDQSSSERRQFALREYVEEILLSLGPKLKRTAHAVTVDCDPTLVVDTFPGALAQILTNLVTNTLMHAYAEGAQGNIRIAAREHDGFIHLEYSDDGVGMTPENLRRIFDPFFTTRRGRGGSGLGMHIVYNLVTQTLGGSIDVASEPGRGLRVRIGVPVSGQKAAA